jgi:hypothetical protein
MRYSLRTLLILAVLGPQGLWLSRPTVRWRYHEAMEALAAELAWMRETGERPLPLFPLLVEWLKLPDELP